MQNETSSGALAPELERDGCLLLNRGGHDIGSFTYLAALKVDRIARRKSWNGEEPICVTVTVCGGPVASLGWVIDSQIHTKLRDCGGS